MLDLTAQRGRESRPLPFVSWTAAEQAGGVALKVSTSSTRSEAETVIMVSTTAQSSPAYAKRPEFVTRTFRSEALA